MAVWTNVGERTRYYVVHPLDDLPEEKHRIDRMDMTKRVRLSLIVLRAYLISMTLLVTFHVLQMAGLFQHVRL
jgi:hypothetical protein